MMFLIFLFTVTFYKLCINDIKLIGLDFEKFDIWTCVLKKFESCWFLKSWFLFASCELLYNNILLERTSLFHFVYANYFHYFLLQYERVQHNNEELHVRLEASELQINNISKEYRAQLHNQEVSFC